MVAWLRPIAAIILPYSLLAGCGAHTATSTGVVPAPSGASHRASGHRKTSGPIQHVVIIIQENRSLDNLFHGYPGAATATTGLKSDGTVVTLQPVSMTAAYDILHRFPQATESIDYPNGEAMDGFDKEPCNGNACATVTNPAYAYVPQSEAAIYWNMARQYVLADHFFASELDSSFEAHQYLIAGQAEQVWGLPNQADKWGCDAPKESIALLNPATEPGTTTSTRIPVCFDPPVTATIDTTLGDELDAAGVSWRYYAPTVGTNVGYIWSAYDAINHIRNGPDWATNVISPPKQFLTDVAAGNLAGVTWIIPDFMNSDHPGNKSKTGPAWVANLVDTIGLSPFWDSTAIFIVWDDWGGFYDSVPPPLLDYDGLGLRVPLITISPYALGPVGSTSSVTHTQYEFGSILGFVEQTFGLAPLAASDTRAAVFGPDVFNFSQAPRAYTRFSTKTDRGFFLSQPASQVAPDSD